MFIAHHIPASSQLFFLLPSIFLVEQINELTYLMLDLSKGIYNNDNNNNNNNNNNTLLLLLFMYLFIDHLLTAAKLAQLGVHQSAKREVIGSNLIQTNNQGFKTKCTYQRHYCHERVCPCK